MAFLDRYAVWLLLVGLVTDVFVTFTGARRDRRFLNRRRKGLTSLQPRSAAPKVSILVAAWQEKSNLSRFIESFEALSYPAKELVICAGGNDGTLEEARRYAGSNIIVLEQQLGEGKQRALWRALEHASGEVIFLTDADCELDDGSFYRILAPLVEDGEEVVTGGFRPLRSQFNNPFVLYQWAIDCFVAARSPSYVTGLQGRNCAVTRGALERVGGFNEDVFTGTDYFLAKKLLRASYRIRYVAGSVVETRYPEDFRTYIHKQSRWVRNLLIHGPQFGAWGDVWAALRTTFLGLGMLAWPLTFPWTGRWGVYLWLVAVAYALLARVRYISFAERMNGRRFGFQVYLRLPLYMLVDFIAWTLPLVDYLLPGQRNRW
jgi:cellulose synthase/poly-beta-1,6-N-acetylglucosamine synthase-like glycosyltransferase